MDCTFWLGHWQYGWHSLQFSPLHPSSQMHAFFVPLIFVQVPWIQSLKVFIDLHNLHLHLGETFEPQIFFSKNYFMFFPPHYSHFFQITVNPSGLVSFLPNYCHFKYFSSWIPSHTRIASSNKILYSGFKIPTLLTHNQVYHKETLSIHFHKCRYWAGQYNIHFYILVVLHIQCS